jgi:hypothetical protein
MVFVQNAVAAELSNFASCLGTTRTSTTLGGQTRRQFVGISTVEFLTVSILIWFASTTPTHRILALLLLPNGFVWSSIALGRDTLVAATAAKFRFALVQQKARLGFEQRTGSAAITLLRDQTGHTLFFIVFQLGFVILH